MRTTTAGNLSVELRDDGVAVVWMNGRMSNALDEGFFYGGGPRIWHELSEDPAVGCVALLSRGRNFCAGIDIGILARHLDGKKPGDTWPADGILVMQDAVTAVERCRKPVVVGVQGACVGGGVDLACACDVRVCDSTARFSVKEVDLGITADLGTLQRLPRIVGDGNARELALTCRTIDAAEALRIGLVSEVVRADGVQPQRLHARCLDLARQIAAKPRSATEGTKRALLHARDHSVADSLRQVAEYNQEHLLSQDLFKAVRAAASAGRVRQPAARL
ncbi:unnamed protein product [Pedinophyceae sp. YPF-701]|nr:unnamed protein product [Pedinophyceae sp. YPF-701]